MTRCVADVYRPAGLARVACARRRPRADGMMARMRRGTLAVMALLCAAGCVDPPGWQVVHEDLPAALLSVWGTSATDVWVVGADAGDGPLVLHYDGMAWERMATGHTGTLWWVFGFDGGPVYMGGEGGTILRYEAGAFTPMSTPGTQTVFGIWGASPDDLWAVGGDSSATGGFAWRLQGETWVEEPTFPEEVPSRAAIWKVHGRSSTDIWLVGSSGVSLHWDGGSLRPAVTGVGESLFTVHGNASRFAAVGGLSNGIVVELEGGEWRDRTVDLAMPGLSGVCLGDGDHGYAVGAYGGVYVRDASGWRAEETRLGIDSNFHAVWIDPTGGVWAAGGQTFTVPLTDGVLVHRGDPIPAGGL